MGNPVGFRALLSRETLRFLSLPNQTILPTVVTTGLYIAIFGYFLGSRIAEVDGHPYRHFIFPGLIILHATMASFQNATTTLFISRWERFVEDLLIAPLSFLEMVMALVLASTVRGVVTGALLLLLGQLLIGLPAAHPFLFLVSLTASVTVFSAAGLIVGLRAERWDHIAVWQNYVLTPLTYLGGVFYSTDVLPPGLRWLNDYNPIFYMVAAARHALLGAADVSFSLSLTVTLLFAAAFFVTAFELFRRGYKLRA
jgi:ABC-2 type transport system permease protein